MSDTQDKDKEIEIEMTQNKEVDMSLSITIEENKSIFERAIIEALKQYNPDECTQKLSIALNEIEYYIEEIRSSNGSKYLLNKNIIDKLNRLIERNLFNVTIQISKIYSSLLESSNYPILSSNQNLLIAFSNEVLNILDIIKSTKVAKTLEKRCSCFLNYLLNDPKFNFDDEQKDILQELLDSFPSRNKSEAFKNFQHLAEQIGTLCRSNSIDDKLKGLSLLMVTFSETNSLDEQYDLLLEYCPQIIKAITYQPNPKYRQMYYQLGNFIISLVFPFKYKIESEVASEQKEEEGNNKSNKHKPKTYFFIDASSPMYQNNKLNFKEETQLSFLNDSLFELTTQKEALMKCETIIAICNLIVNTLSIYDQMFELQYVCYLISKTIYLSFPQYRNDIEDSLTGTLINLCQFKDKEERYNTIECRQFLHYLLNCRGEESLKAKIQNGIKSKESNGIDIKLEEGVQSNLIAVEYQHLYLDDFNLRIGFPNHYRIDAGTQYECYIEVEKTNSLIYIAFCSISHDITFRLLKYISNNEGSNSNGNGNSNNNTNVDKNISDEGHFHEVFKIEKVICIDNSIKIILFVHSPGIYKLIYDNTYSWITSKTIKHRLSVLKPISPINVFSLKNDNSDINTNTDNKAIITKSMVIKHEGIMRTIDFNSIQIKQCLMIKEQSSILYLPIILTKNSIRLIELTKDKLGYSTHTYKELLTEDNDKMDLNSFESAIESYLLANKYITESTPIKTIYLSVFINDKTIAEEDIVPMSNYEHIRSSIMKIGFYPGNLISKYNHIRYSCLKISDCCIMAILHERMINDIKIASLIHIHFDRKGASASSYSAGIIQDRVNGFVYDNNKAMTENMDNVIEFINKAIESFEAFDLSISQSDIDSVIFKSCCLVLGEKIKQLNTTIAFKACDQEFVENVFKYSTLFFINTLSYFIN